jgi:hypothetical protein
MLIRQTASEPTLISLADEWKGYLGQAGRIKVCGYSEGIGQIVSTGAHLVEIQCYFDDLSLYQKIVCQYWMIDHFSPDELLTAKIQLLKQFSLKLP